MILYFTAKQMQRNPAEAFEYFCSGKISYAGKHQSKLSVCGAGKLLQDLKARWGA